MAGKRLGERTGAVLIGSMLMRSYCERGARRWAEGSADKSLFETNLERQRLLEVGGALQPLRAGRWRRSGVVFGHGYLFCWD